MQVYGGKVKALALGAFAAATMAAAGAAQAGTITFDGFGMTTNGDAGLNGANLQLVPQTAFNQEGSAFITTPFAIGNSTPFSASFSFALANNNSNLNAQTGLGLADGLTFVLQNAGINALGSTAIGGSGLGYFNMTPSVAVELRTFVNNEIEIDHNGTVGAGTHTLLAHMPGNQKNVQDTGTISVAYNGAGLLTVTGTDTGPTGTDSFSLSSTVDLSGLGGSAFIGFTGADGAGVSDEEITNFTLAVPEPTSLALFGAGLAGLGWLRRRKRT